MKNLLLAVGTVTALAVAGPAFAQTGSSDWGWSGAAMNYANAYSYYPYGYGYGYGYYPYWDSYGAYYGRPSRYRRYSRAYGELNNSNRAFGSGYGNSYAFGYEARVARGRRDGTVPNNYGSYCGQLPKAC